MISAAYAELRRAKDFGERKAVEVAKTLYERDGQEEQFEKDLVAHLRDGFVWSLPNAFLMARMVELEDGRRAWLVNCAVGDLRELLARSPYPLPFIAFYRGPDEKHPRRDGKKLRVYEAKRLSVICYRLALKKEPI
jgi:hypothetical protein